MTSINPQNPSRREMIKKMGVALGASISANSILAAVDSFYQKQSSNKGTRSILTESELQLVAEISDLIIPTTDTPGAKAANIHGFIDHMLTHCYSKETTLAFKKGLALIDEQSKNEAGELFLQLPKERQFSMLENLDAEMTANNIDRAEKDFFSRLNRFVSRKLMSNKDLAIIDFFSLLKYLVIFGYSTSEIGATQAMRYIAIPGMYRACVPFDEIGRLWAT